MAKDKCGKDGNVLLLAHESLMQRLVLSTLLRK